MVTMDIFGCTVFTTLGLVRKVLKEEPPKILVVSFVMLFSLAINYFEINLYVMVIAVTIIVSNGVVSNYIDLTFIWLAFLNFFSGLLISYELSNRHLHMTYPVLIADLMGLVRTNLYKHVNSYYIPKMVAILSLYFVNPLFYRMVQN